MEKEKKKTGVSRLFEIAGQKKGLLVLSGVLSAASACCMLIPFLSVYQILKELLEHAGDLQLVDRAWMIRWGWIALAGVGSGLVLLYASLMSSHVAAFRILYGLRIRLAGHIGKLPLGYLNNTSTGAIKKTMEENIEKIETFIAHTIPDLVNVGTTVVVMFVLFFSLNGWMAAACLLAILIGMGSQVTMMMGSVRNDLLRQYFDIQEQLSASAVQYVRGMPVIKIFGQSVHSFRQFYKEIEGYKDCALKMCDLYSPGMIAFTVLLNLVVTFILPVGLLILSGDPANLAFAVVYLFFIILGPGVTSPVYKLTFMAQNLQTIDEGVNRIDRIFSEDPVPAPVIPCLPDGYDITFEGVSFAYENRQQATRTQALTDISFTAKAGEITALVGPSGSGKSTVANLIPRFWDISEGTIRIGGVDVKSIEEKRLMEMVSFVFQQSFLFF